MNGKPTRITARAVRVGFFVLQGHSRRETHIPQPCFEVQQMVHGKETLSIGVNLIVKNFLLNHVGETPKAMKIEITQWRLKKLLGLAEMSP